jgi:hypothetical protein
MSEDTPTMWVHIDTGPDGKPVVKHEKELNEWVSQLEDELAGLEHDIWDCTLLDRHVHPIALAHFLRREAQSLEQMYFEDPETWEVGEDE